MPGAKDCCINFFAGPADRNSASINHRITTRHIFRTSGGSLDDLRNPSS